MEKNFLVVTNNDLVKEKYEDMEIVSVDGGYLDVLYKVRNLIHLGHKLISHPLGASIRMMYSPQRSIILSNKTKEIDQLSIEVIESSIRKYIITLENRKVDSSNYKDYEYMDLILLDAAMREVQKYEVVI